MKENYESWKKNLERFCEKNGSIFKIEKHPSIGYGANFITGSTEIIWIATKILISQSGIVGIDEIGLSTLNIQYEYENSDYFALNLNKRDFLDKLFFRNRIKTNDIKFDGLFTINSNEKLLGEKIFTDKIVQDFFTSNPLLTFNIQTSKHITYVVLKNMESKIYSINELQYFFDNFKNIMTRILF